MDTPTTCSATIATYVLNSVPSCQTEYQVMITLIGARLIRQVIAKFMLYEFVKFQKVILTSAACRNVWWTVMQIWMHLSWTNKSDKLCHIEWLTEQTLLRIWEGGGANLCKITWSLLAARYCWRSLSRCSLHVRELTRFSIPPVSAFTASLTIKSLQLW